MTKERRRELYRKAAEWSGSDPVDAYMAGVYDAMHPNSLEFADFSVVREYLVGEDPESEDPESEDIGWEDIQLIVRIYDECCDTIRPNERDCKWMLKMYKLMKEQINEAH